MSLIAILQRDPAENPLVTFGKLYLPWLKVQPDIYTIELPWKNNQPNVSCIPAGVYTLKPYSSPRHQNVWEYQDVVGRSYCLMHSANYACNVTTPDGVFHANELEGCTAPGFGIEETVPRLDRSKDAINYLRATIGIKTTWQLEIKD